jgi:hypothetical protein
MPAARRIEVRAEAPSGRVNSVNFAVKENFPGYCWMAIMVTAALEAFSLYGLRESRYRYKAGRRMA